jgi:hypothetical protein
MKNRNLLNEVTRIKEMMGVKLITEKVLDYFLEPVIKAAEKGLESAEVKSLKSAIESSLDDVLKAVDNPLSKKMESAGIRSIEDLAKIGEKGLEKKEIQQIEEYMANNILKKLESTGQGDLVDRVMAKGFAGIDEFKGFSDNVNDFVEMFANERLSKEDVQMAKDSLIELVKMKNTIKSSNLPEDQIEKLVGDIDSAISKIDKNIKSLEGLAGDAVKEMSDAEIQAALDKLRNIDNGPKGPSVEMVEDYIVDQISASGLPLGRLDVNKVAKQLAIDWSKKSGVEIERLIPILEKMGPLEQEKQIMAVVEKFKGSLPPSAFENLKKTLGLGFKNVQKLPPAQMLANVLWKVYVYGGLVAIIYNIRQQPKAVSTMDKAIAFGSSVLGGIVWPYDVFSKSDAPEANGTTPVTPVTPVTPTTPAVASKTTFDTYMSGASKIFSENKSSYTWDVDPSDNTIIIVHTPAAGDVKYKVNSDGTTYKKQ